MVALALGLIGIVLLVADALLSSEPGQRLRLGAQAVALFILGTIELEHLGDTANWRLLLVVAVNLWTCAGGFFFLVYEPHRRRVWRRTHPSGTHPDSADPSGAHTSGAHTSGTHTSSTHTSSTHTSGTHTSV